MAGRAFGRRPPGWAMTGDTGFNSGNKNVGGKPALGGMMTVIAFDHRVLRVIEVRLRHPAIDEERPDDDRCGVSHCLDFMAQGAAIE